MNELTTTNNTEKRLLELLRRAKLDGRPKIFVINVSPPGIISILIATPEHEQVARKEKVQ